jgi:serine protease Do
MVTPPGQGNHRTAETLGMRLATPTQDLAEKFGLPENAHGAVVTSVQPRSAADHAGLQPGDVITQVDRKPAGSADEVSNLISKHSGKTPILLYVESGANGGHIVAIEPKK